MTKKNQNRKTGKKLDFTFKSVPSNQDNKIIPAVIHGYTSVSSSAGGVINATISNDPATISNTDWADFSSTYDEFRLLGVRIRICSLVSNLAVNDALVVVAYDNDSSAALTTFTEGQQYSTAKVFPAQFTNTNGSMMTKVWYRPTAGKETTIPWCDVATSSSSTGGVKFYSTGLTASTAYFAYTVEHLVEFRGRR